MGNDRPVTGLVVRYHYLWAREQERGEETGRKAKPACVVVPLGTRPGAVVLFPVATQPPTAGRLAIEIPETERRRLSLRGDGPNWIILDEANGDVMPGSYHLEPVSRLPMEFAYGRLSQAFMRVVLRTVATALRNRSMRIVAREP